MAHDLELLSNGTSAFAYAGNRKGWHGLGQAIPEGTEYSEQVIQLAGLDTTVMKAKLFIKSKTEGYREMTDQFALVRVEDGRVFGYAGDQYTVYQNRSAFQDMDALAQDHRMKYETAGATKNGAHVFILARIGEDFLVAGKDPVTPYILLSNSHDGSSAVTIKPVTTRVVCANTLAVAMGERTNTLKVRHTASVRERITTANKVFELMSRRQAEMFEKFNQLAQMKASYDLQLNVCNIVAPAALESDSARTTEKRKRERLAFFNHMLNSETVKFAGGPENRWGLFNAATEWLDWIEPRSGQDITKDGDKALERRMATTTDGEAAGQRQTIFNMLVKA